MGTLYDLLGALPRDDAESLRTAFRKAAKTRHPDINPGDPDAALRFRELVRAYDILGDADQRATYDELLAIALQPAASKSTRFYDRIRKFASSTIAATIISGVLIGGYALFERLHTKPGAAEIVTGATTPRSEEIAAATLPDPSAQNGSGNAGEGTIVTAAVVTAVNEGAVQAVASASPGLIARGGKPHRRQRVALRDDSSRPTTVSDPAVRHDPGVGEAGVDRGAILFRMHEFNRAFANMARAKRIAEQSRARIPLPVPRRISSVRVRAPDKWRPMIAATTP
jgi:curved DNA-binding protein CbpA